MTIPVAALTRRLADTPPDFRGDPDVAAVVSDLLVAHGGPPLDEATADPLRAADAGVRRLVLIACWLAYDEALRATGSASAVWRLLRDVAPPLAALVPAERFVTDPDRREELARLALRTLGVTPAGETAAEAADRLSTLDTIRRHEVLAEARRVEERAKAVREALAAKRAEEAAQRYNPV